MCACVALRRERDDRAVQISRLQGRLSDTLDTDWLHLRGRCLKLEAGDQGHFTVCLFEEVLRLPPATAAAVAAATAAAGVTRPRMEVVGRWKREGKWNEPRTAIGVPAASEAEGAGGVGDSAEPLPPQHLSMHFEQGGACTAQPGANLSAVVELRCATPRPKHGQPAALAPYDELISVHSPEGRPCHYVIALATPDACSTYGTAAADAASTAGIVVVPLPRLNDDENEELEAQAREKALVEAKMAESTAEKAATRRAAEDQHRLAMDDQRKQKHLDMQMQQQLAAIQRKKEERLAKRAREKLEDEQAAAKVAAAAAADTVAAEEAAGAAAAAGEGAPALSGGSRSFGTPAAAPQELSGSLHEDREL